MQVFVDRDTINDDLVQIIEIHENSNSIVKKDDLIVTIETSKTAIEMHAPCDGILSISINIGDEIEVGGQLFEILSKEQSEKIDSNKEKAEQTLKPDVNVSEYIFSKEAEKKIKELGLKDLIFSKKFVNIEDVMAVIEGKDNSNNLDKKVVKDKELETIINDLPKVNASYKQEKNSLRKRSEIHNLSSNGNISTQSVISIDINTLLPRSSETPYLFQGTISDLVIYETSKLLRDYKELNSFFINNRELGVYDNINFGVSFDSGKNLKVLSIIDSDSKSLVEIQKNIEELLELYESGNTISEEILTSSTITISDLTNTNASYMQPLVSIGQSSIIGLIKKSDFLFKIFLGFDHKVTEGMYVTRFLEELKENIESYFINNQINHDLDCSICGMSMKSIKELNQLGMIMVMKENGKIESVCQVCFDGW